jgi:hypothetical protein
MAIPIPPLILAFAPEGKDGRIDLIHIDVPEKTIRASARAGRNTIGRPGSAISLKNDAQCAGGIIRP